MTRITQLDSLVTKMSLSAARGGGDLLQSSRQTPTVLVVLPATLVRHPMMIDTADAG